MHFVAWDIETDKLAPEDWDNTGSSLKRKRGDDEGYEGCTFGKQTTAPALNITVAATRRTLANGKQEALVWATPTAASGMTCPIPESVYSALETRSVESAECKQENKEHDALEEVDLVSLAQSPMLCEPHMRPEDVRAMALYLEECVGDGCVVSTYNALGFDFRVVHSILEATGRQKIRDAVDPYEAEEAAVQYMELAERIRSLARSQYHFDIAFSFFAHKGFMVSLSKASAGTLGTEFKKFEISGADAPSLFTKDRLWQNTVLKYCAQDVNLQAALQQRIFETGDFKWVTKRGGTSTWRVPTLQSAESEDQAEDSDTPAERRLNLGVEYSLKQPEPDVSWMEKYDMTPWRRSKFVAWL